MSDFSPVGSPTPVKNETGTTHTTLEGSVTIANEGDLVIIGFNAFVTGSPTFTLDDTSSNDWLLGTSFMNGEIHAGFFWAQAKAAGEITLTLASTVAGDMAFSANEFALPTGTSIVSLVTTAISAGTTSTTTPSTGNMTFTGNSLVYGVFAEDDNSQTSHAAGTGFTELTSFIGVGTDFVGYLDEFQVTSASPVSAAAVWGVSAFSAAVAGVFQASSPPPPPPSTGTRWHTGDGVNHGRSRRFRHRQHQ
jgi:hypothetical protein